MTKKMRLATGTVAGLLSAAAGVGASMFAAALTGAPTATDAIGNRFIRMTPEWLKEFAIENFGTADKLVLKIGIFAILAILAIVAGTLAWRSVAAAAGLTALLGVLAIAAAITDPSTLVGPVAKVLPSVVATIVSTLAMVAFARTFHSGSAASRSAGTSTTTREGSHV